jgi:hypothetical protein
MRTRSATSSAELSSGRRYGLAMTCARRQRAKMMKMTERRLWGGQGVGGEMG